MFKCQAFFLKDCMDCATKQKYNLQFLTKGTGTCD